MRDGRQARIHFSGAGQTHRVTCAAVKQNRIQSAGLITALLLTLTMPLCAQQMASPAILSGIVRDGRGAPQAGALVQLLAVRSQNSFDSMMSPAVAFTDNHGRYVFARVLPGEYALHASAALFLPALRDNVRLAAGTRTVINMTLSTLFEASEWLPAERRRADEPGDDWKWTLRSTVNRPLMRLAGHNDALSLSTSASERSMPQTQARVAMTNGDGGFAAGGMHNIFTVDRVLDDGSGVILRADLAAAQGGHPVPPSADLSAGYERRINYNTTARMVTAFSSHPELVNSITPGGMQSMLVESAEQMQLTDALGMDVGAALTGVQIGNNAAVMQPFLKVVVSPMESILVTYRIATARNFQDSEDMNTIDMGTPDAGVAQGHVRIQNGMHQEASLGKRTGRGLVQAAWYHDRIVNPIVNGGGIINTAALMTGNYVADPATDSFRIVGANYHGSGVNLSVNEPLCGALWAILDYSTGTALALQGQPAAMDVATLGEMTLQNAGMSAVRSETATAALRGRIAKTNTHLRAAYRWQPQHTVTAVNPYHAFSDQAYLSFFVRQPLHVHGILPRGTEATVDVTNLLAQGYQPVATDGEGNAIYFAQAERALEAGLSFTF